MTEPETINPVDSAAEPVEVNLIQPQSDSEEVSSALTVEPARSSLWRRLIQGLSLTTIIVMLFTLSAQEATTRIWDGAIALATSLTEPTFDPAVPFLVTMQSDSAAGRAFALEAPVTDPSVHASLLARDFSPAVPAGSRDDTFLLTGTVDEPLSIVGIRPVSVERTPAYVGTFVRVPIGGQGGTGRRTLQVDLGTGVASVASSAPESGPAADFFADAVIDLQSGPRYILTLTVKAEEAATTSWVYEVEYIDPAGHQRVVYLDASGALTEDLSAVPRDSRFIITSIVENYSVVYGPDAANSLARLDGVTQPPPVS